MRGTAGDGEGDSGRDGEEDTVRDTVRRRIRTITACRTRSAPSTATSTAALASSPLPQARRGLASQPLRRERMESIGFQWANGRYAGPASSLAAVLDTERGREGSLRCHMPPLSYLKEAAARSSSSLPPLLPPAWDRYAHCSNVWNPDSTWWIMERVGECAFHRKITALSVSLAPPSLRLSPAGSCGSAAAAPLHSPSSPPPPRHGVLCAARWGPAVRQPAPPSPHP